jgi:hypothetical protein
MLSKQYEFTTGSTETTKVLDFSDHFTFTNKPFLVQLYKDSGANYEIVLLGDGIGLDSSGLEVDLQCSNLTINESDNTFQLSWLNTNTTYKIVILQLS